MYGVHSWPMERHCDPDDLITLKAAFLRSQGYEVKILIKRDQKDRITEMSAIAIPPSR